MDADIYSTCLCTLMLEVYYMILPSYKQMAVHGTEPPSAKSENSDDTLTL